MPVYSKGRAVCCLCGLLVAQEYDLTSVPSSGVRRLCHRSCLLEPDHATLRREWEDWTERASSGRPLLAAGLHGSKLWRFGSSVRLVCTSRLLDFDVPAEDLEPIAEWLRVLSSGSTVGALRLGSMEFSYEDSEISCVLDSESIVLREGVTLSEVSEFLVLMEAALAQVVPED